MTYPRSRPFAIRDVSGSCDLSIGANANLPERKKEREQSEDVTSRVAVGVDENWTRLARGGWLPCIW